MSSKKKLINRKILTVFLMLCMIMVLPYRVSAAEKPDPDRNVSLTVSCRDDSQSIQGMTFRLYRVADVTEDVEFSLTEAFKDSGVSLAGMDTASWQAAADTLNDYIAAHPSIQPLDSGATDVSGQLNFPTGQTVMKAGLYLLTGDQIQSDENIYTPGHSLICLPEQNTDGKWLYETVVYPKMNKTGTQTDRKVMKIWKDDGYTDKRPKQIEVNLIHDGSLYETVTLNAENQWQYTWHDLSGLGEWKVEEKEIPVGYTASIQADGTGFVITNTYTPPTTPPSTPPHLPQTGVLWWPVPILAAAGMLLFMLGWLRRQKNGKSDENK